jgi:hypothetical protein
MQNTEPTRSEPARVPAMPAPRGPDTPSVSLPDAEAYRLGSDRLMGISRNGYTVVGERRTRHPDSDDRRNGIFERLVSGDDDVAGLIAYSVYKQNKRDWLKAFETARSRAPTLDEEVAYTIGESTTRRLAMYRQMAEATFIGQAATRQAAIDDHADPRGARALDSQSAALPLQRPIPEPAMPRAAENKSYGALALYAAVLGLAGFGLWASVRFLFPGAVH